MTASSTINLQPEITRVASVSRAVPVRRGVPFFEADAKSQESSSPGGKIFPPKAVEFWQRKEQLRRDPHRCCRCAKLNDNGHRQCDACRQYAAEYRKRMRNRKDMALIDAGLIGELKRRVENLEHYFARLSALGRVEYKRGYAAGRRLHRKAQEARSYEEALFKHSKAEVLG